jgi:hypothetical protein
MTNSKASNRKKRTHFNFQDLLKNGKWSDTGCLEWQGSLNRDGYGYFWFDGKSVRAHRYSLSLFIKPVTSNLNALHSCDNRKCFNPDHLRWGTQTENIADRTARGRTARLIGEDASRTKLTPADIYLIRKMYADGATVKKTAEKIGCSLGAITHVRSGRTWSHI